MTSFSYTANNWAWVQSRVMTFTVSRPSGCQLLAVAAPLRVEYDGSVSATVFKPFFTGTAHNTLPLEHLDVRIK